MLDDWYFCSASNLTPRAAHAFLDLLEALRADEQDTAGAGDLVLVALNQLAGAEPGQLLYAVPDVLTAGRRLFAAATLVPAAASARLEEAFAVHPVTAPAAGLAKFGTSQEEFTHALGALLESRRAMAPSTTPQGHAYQDLVQHAPETLILAVVVDRIAGDPAFRRTAREIPELARLVETAVTGRFGRAAALHALKLTKTADFEAARSAVLATGGFPWLEPDLMKAVVTARFVAGGQVDHGALRTELANPELFAALVTSTADRGEMVGQVAQIIGCRDNRKIESFALALWQITLADVAHRVDAGGTVDWLRESWELTDHAVKKEDDAPWIRRKRAWWAPRDPVSPQEDDNADPLTARKHDALRHRLSQFEDCADNHVLLRLLGAASVAMRVVRRTSAPERDDPVFLLLLMHTADVLMDKRHRQILENLRVGKPPRASSNLSAPLLMLALHLKSVIDRTATTRPHGVDPRRIAAVVMAARTRHVWNSPAGKIAYLAPVMVTVEWILNALSGHTGIAGAGGRWFVVDEEQLRPPARTFLRWTIDMLHEEWQNADVVHKDKDGVFSFYLLRPELLLTQLWPDEPRGRETDWTVKALDGGKALLNTEDVLLGEPLSIARWQEMSGKVNPAKLGAGADLTLVSELLRAALEHDVSDPPFGRWLGEWQQLVAAINDPRRFRRDMRRRLAAMAKMPAPTIERQARLREVLEEVIDSIVEFSGDSQNELWLLAENICAPETASHERKLRQALRLRLLLADSLVDRATHTERVIGPHALIGHQEGARIRRRILEHVVYTAANVDNDEPGPVDLWSRRPPAPPVCVQHPDPRLVVRAWVGNGLVPSFEQTARQWRTEDGWIRGSVAAVELIEDHRYATEVNCGRGEPVTVHAHQRWDIGDPVELNLEKRSIRALGAAGPQHGEVRCATVRPRKRAHFGSCPAVLVDGVELVFDESTPDEAFLRWDPDTSKAFESAEDEPEYVVLAEWHAKDGWWYPADRTMAELIAHLSVPENRAGATLTLAGTWNSGEGRRWRLSARTGVVFVIGDDDWSTASLRQLREEEGGLRITLGLEDLGGGQPRLAMRGEDPLDHRNQLWASAPGNDMAQAEVSAHNANWIVRTDVPGFPDEVTLLRFAEPLEARWCDVTVNAWTCWHQRTAMASASKVESYALENVDSPSTEVFDRVFNLGELDHVRLSRTANRYSDSSWLVRTTDGLVVRAAGESITLSGITAGGYVNDQVRGRVATVVSCVKQRAQHRGGQPAGTDVLVDCFDAAPGFAEPLRNGVAPRMLCAEMPRKGGVTDDSLVTLWARVGTETGDVVVGKVPGWMFQSAPRRAGDVVELVRVEDGWQLRSCSRDYLVRALWTAERRARADSSSTYVGMATREDELVDVWQRGSTLLLTPPDDSLEGSRIRAATQALLVGGSVESKKHRDPRGGVRVSVKSADGADYPGTSRKTPGFGAEVLTTSVLLETVGALTDVRRVFELRHPRENPTATSDDALMRAWESFCRQPDQHLRGEFNGGGGSVVVVRDRQILFGGSPRRWSNRVPMADAEHTWVEAPYNRNDVRFVLVGEGAETRASCAAVVPLDPEEFRTEMAQNYRLGRHPLKLGSTPLRYAGLGDGEEPAHRFEWGYGLRAEIPADQVRLRGRQVRPGDLFFGDMVRQARIPGDGPMILDIVEVAVELNPDRTLVEDAENQIVHRVEAEVDLASGTAWVLAVHGRRRGYAHHEHDDSARVQPHRAVLSEDTTAWLVNRVRREAGAADTGRHVREILAVVDTTSDPAVSGAPLMLRRVTKLDKGQRVFLAPERIIRRGNELVVLMKLPGNVTADDGLQTVRVRRRDFSQREGLLRQLYKLRSRELPYSVVLVEVFGSAEPGARLSGKVARDPKLSRHPRDLHSLVRLSEGRCYAVVVRTGKALVLEVRPGACFWLKQADYTLVDRVATSSIVRLVSGSDRKIEVRLAVKGDDYYLTEQARPAVVLPKDSLLFGEPKPDMLVKDRPFTVAGLPGTPANAGSVDDGKVIMYETHPKIVSVSRARLQGKVLDPVVTVPSDDVRVGSLVLDVNRGTASVRPHDGSDDVHVAWAQLSFADVDARTIEARTSGMNRCWNYHDSMTGRWRTDSRGVLSIEREDIEAGVSAGTGPLFFTKQWSLRYPEPELRRFGFPVSAVLDDLSAEIGAEPDSYVIAAPVRRGDGLWVETFPGRVLEISGELVAAGTAANRPLARLDWSRFSTGDQVELRLHHRGDDRSEVACVSLLGWTAGPRGALGYQRALLPLVGKNITRFSVLLGAGAWQLTYPIEPARMHTGAGARSMWLSASNELTEHVEVDGPVRGDVILVGSGSDDDGRLRVHGLKGFSARFSETTEVGWLADALRERRSRRNLFELLHDALPVTVEAVDGQEFEVSTRCQLFGRAQPGTDVLATVLGLLTERLVLVRAGATLLTVDIDRLVPGLPHKLREIVIKALRQRGELHWFHADADGELIAGAEATEARVQTVELRQVLGAGYAGYGVLCRDPRTLQWRWLPAEELGWVTGLDDIELKRFVQSRPDTLTCAVLPDGRLSLRAADEVARRAGVLSPGDVVRVEVLGQRRTPAQRRYLAVLHQTDVLVEFEARGAVEEIESRDLRETEVEVYVGHRVLVVSVGQRRTTLDLPRRLIARLACLSEEKTTWVLPDPVNRRLSTTLEAQSDELADVLSSWLKKHGRVAAGLEEGDLDLAETLSAVLALDTLCPEEDDTRGRLAVWLAWRTGLAAMRSLHVEPIVVHWLGDPDRLRRRRWQRLAVVGASLNERMTSAQMQGLLSFCRGILGRHAVLDEKELQTVARALLVATGHLRTTDEPLSLDSTLGRISSLARALAPQPGETTAQPRLLPQQKSLIRTAWSQTRTEDTELPLLPPLQSLSADQRNEAARLLATVSAVERRR